MEDTQVTVDPLNMPLALRQKIATDWLALLDAEEERKCRSTLRWITEYPRTKEKVCMHCVLGLACEAAVRNGVGRWDDGWSNETDDHVGTYTYKIEGVMNGWESVVPLLEQLGVIDESMKEERWGYRKYSPWCTPLVDMNDADSLPFSQIKPAVQEIVAPLLAAS